MNAFRPKKHTPLRVKLLAVFAIASLLVSGLTFAIWWAGAAITWPSAPAGEAEGGAITRYLYNIIGNNGAWKSCTNSGVVIWFDADGTPRCSSVSSLLMATSISSFTASNNAIISWSPVTLTWSVTNASSCSATNTTNSNQWSGSKSVGISQTGSVSPTSTTTYTLQCSGASGLFSDTKTVTVTVYQNPTISSFSANSTSIAAGSSTQLSWTTSNVTGWCTLNPGSVAKSANDSHVVTPTSNTIYSLTCTGFNNATVTSSSVTITVNEPPSLIFESSTSVAYNESAALAWSITNATSCTASNFTLPNAYLTTNLSIILDNLTATQTYTLSCTGPGGSTSKSVTVNVANPKVPNVTLIASSTSVYNNAKNVDLTWTVSNATSCTASSWWSWDKSIYGGSTVVLPANSTTTTYTLTCNGQWGTSDTKSVSVMAVAPITPSVTLTASSTSVYNDVSVTLSWTASNATSCTASSIPGWSWWDWSKSISGGSQTIYPIDDRSTTYTLTCNGQSGTSDTKSVTVDSARMPEVSISLSKTTWPNILSWDVSFARTCTANNFSFPNGFIHFGYNWTSSTEVYPSITTTTTYSITCSASAGPPVTRSVDSIGNPIQLTPFSMDYNITPSIVMPTWPIDFSDLPGNINFGSFGW